MIIKSLSRKDPSFKQLINYLQRDYDKQYIFSHNLYVNNLTNIDEVNKEFLENYKFLKKQKNSNALYHDIISFSKSDNDIKIQKDALFDVVNEYIKVRANKCLVYGIMHEGHNNIHYHLMISSNEIENNKNHYLSIKQFNDVKKGAEIYVNQKYPELKQGIVINIDKKQKTKSRKEFEYIKRTGNKSQKEIFKDKLKDVFQQSKTKQDFFDNLYKNKIDIKVRNTTITFLDLVTGGRHRLKKLDLENEFNLMSKKIELNEKQKDNKSTEHNIKQDFKEINKKTVHEIKKEVLKEKEHEKQKTKDEQKIDEIQKRKEFLKRVREQVKNNKDFDRNKWLIQKDRQEIMSIIEKIENVITSLKNDTKQFITGEPQNRTNEFEEGKTEAEQEGIINERKESVKKSRNQNNNNSREFNR